MTEPQCLIISPTEEASVYFYSAPARLITPAVIKAVKEGGRSVLYGVLFMDLEDQNEYWKTRKRELAACLQPLIGQIKPLDTTHWCGTFGKGPWASFLTVYDWV